MAAVKNALFDAAMSADVMLTDAILLNAIDSVRNAKENVGTWKRNVRTTIRELSPDEAKGEGIL